MLRRFLYSFAGCLVLTLNLTGTGVNAHPGHPTLTTTSTDDAGVTAPATFAVCDPNPGQPCSSDAKSGNEEPLGPRVVTVNLHGFSPNTTVHLWWLKGEMANEAGTDCRQLVTSARTHLTDASNNNIDVTTDSNGDATVTGVTLPPGNQGQHWDYGPNWVCGTTHSHNGSATGQIADRMFTIYPA